jgi:hypothetical protein
LHRHTYVTLPTEPPDRRARFRRNPFVADLFHASLLRRRRVSTQAPPSTRRGGTASAWTCRSLVRTSDRPTGGRARAPGSGSCPALEAPAGSSPARYLRALAHDRPLPPPGSGGAPLPGGVGYYRLGAGLRFASLLDPFPGQVGFGHPPSLNLSAPRLRRPSGSLWRASPRTICRPPGSARGFPRLRETPAPTPRLPTRGARRSCLDSCRPLPS